jgi:hypothetical protein
MRAKMTKIPCIRYDMKETKSKKHKNSVKRGKNSVKREFFFKGSCILQNFHGVIIVDLGQNIAHETHIS